jgi:adenosylcobinamide-GDP ribazoletransferase
MFTKIPMPKVNFEKANMKYSLAFLSIVGLIVGFVMWGFLKLSPFGLALNAIILTVIPVAITGGIHIDGFCDTVDALSSHAPKEKKIEILEDPHCGAFAVIWVCVYFLLFFGICAEMQTETEFSCGIIAIPVMSRAVGAFASLVFPCPKSFKKGVLLQTLRPQKAKKEAIISIIFTLIFFASGALFAPFSAIFMAICGAYVYFMSKKNFGGMSGDIAGYLISISELFGLAGLLI